MLEYRSYGELDADRCPTSQTVNGNEVEEPKEELIAHQDGTKQVAQDQGSEVFLGIREPIECCHDDSGQVEQGYECEELAIGGGFFCTGLSSDGFSAGGERGQAASGLRGIIGLDTVGVIPS